MNRKTLLAFFTALGVWTSSASAYEVWMGTHLMRSADADDLPAWSRCAAQLDGFNINRAPHDTDPASNNDWRTIISQFTNARHQMSEIARSEVTRNPVQVDDLAEDEIDQRLSEIFGFENTFDYDLTILMFYNERGTYQGTEYLYEWTEIEVQHMRDWMDENGHADVQLMWNVRNNSVENQNWAKHPLVDLVEIEASSTAFLANTNNQRTFFDWFWTNPVTTNKRIALQLPRVLPGDPLNQFQGTRRVAQSLGGTIGYGEDGMRSDRLVFLPVTYNDNYDYLPETVSGGSAYTNTLTSTALSLIEQRDLFEGRLASLPTVADADSVVRTAPPTISEIMNQVVSPNGASGAIAFTIADDDTALGSLTLSATTSNPAVVPPGGIVFGGSGANRHVTITPAIGQTGASEITVEVRDGMWSDGTTFRLVVGGSLFSVASDASVRDNMVVVDQSNATTLLGAGGNSPWVDRCTVYAFQLPDLGATSNPFTSAFFSFNYEAKQGTLKDNDLYGLGRRPAAAVLGSDYYGQTSVSDSTDATRLQTDIVTNATPLGTIETSPAGGTALLDYLNAEYASGAGIGDFVFLRLNTAASKTGINRATLTMSEGDVANRPRIVFTGGSPSADFGAPIAHWPLDEGTGTMADDATGNGYTGTLLNGARWGSDGTRASYVSFDGTDDRISTPFTYALSAGDDFTWAWWANPDAATHSGSIMLGNRYPQPGPGGETFEFIKLTPAHGQFAATSDVGTIERHEYGLIASGVWRHYAMVKSGTSYQWYVDGVAQGAAETINYSQPAPIPFLIGGDDNGTGRVNEHFEGSIDDVVLYGRALDSDEVNDVRNGIYSEPLLTGEMAGLENDADAREDSVIVNLGADNLVPGRSGPNGGLDRSTVFVFQLPDLGSTTDPFISATLGFDVYDVSDTPPGVDLYGLGKRTSPNVLVNDYHGNTASTDTSDATLIQRNLLTGGTGTGPKASGSLIVYLNEQYASGSGIGDYVFLRLSTNAPYTGHQRHFITSANAPGEDRPSISYTASAPDEDDFTSWLAQFSFPPGADLNPEADPDADGLSTRFEYLFGLDPSDPTSIHAITHPPAMSSGSFVYTRRNPILTGISNYQIWISEELATWTLDSTAEQLPDGGDDIQAVTVTLTEPINATRLFVRVGVE